MGKKLLILALATVMMFGVFGLTACDLGSESLTDYKITKSNELQAHADAKGEANYSDGGWQAVCNALTEGKQAIENATTRPAVTKAFEDAKGVIDAVAPKIEADNFALTIMVEQTTMKQGEDFKIDVELKNNNSEGVEISYGVLFWLHSPNIGGRPQVFIPKTKFFEANSAIQEVIELTLANFGLILEPGEHELKFSAEFYLKESDQHIEILSNTITLTIATGSIELIEVETGDIVDCSLFCLVRIGPDAPVYPSDPIILHYPNDDAIFECIVDEGYILPFGSEPTKGANFKSGDGFRWQPENEADIKPAFITMVLKLDNHIIGYAIVEIYKLGQCYSARLLRAAFFPLVGDEYQQISTKEMNDIIELRTEAGRKETEDLIKPVKDYFISSGLTVLQNYGIFNGNVVTRGSHGATLGGVEFEIDGVWFRFIDGQLPMVWNGGHFYALEDAYAMGLLSKENLIVIAKLAYVYFMYIATYPVG